MPPRRSPSSASLAAPSPDLENVPWSSGTQKPRVTLPSGAVDGVHHIFDHCFPVAPGAVTPPDATAADYLKLRRRLGLSRNVIAQATNYGFDNSCILDAIRQIGPSARGIAIVNGDVTDAELQKLHDGGVRGGRFFFGAANLVAPEMMKPMSRRFADLGWHIQFQAPPEQTLQMADILSDLDCPIVFDHFARIPAQVGARHPVFALVARLMAQGKAWVKLSGPYHVSADGPPNYDDAGRLVQAFLQAAPERLLWGSGWPHSNLPADRKPDDAQMLDQLASWIPDEALRARMLVDNPARLYDFD
jgi:predicted TIM-barrel fold metal-dependent hydrolase